MVLGSSTESQTHERNKREMAGWTTNLVKLEKGLREHLWTRASSALEVLNAHHTHWTGLDWTAPSIKAETAVGKRLQESLLMAAQRKSYNRTIKYRSPWGQQLIFGL